MKKLNVDFISGEEWRTLPEYPNYMFSNLGRVYSFYRNKIIQPYEYNIRTGYYRIDLSVDKKVIKVMIHRVIATAFHSNPDNKPIVHHIDHDVRNNKADNLMWVTPQEHKEFHKRKPRKNNKKIKK